MSLSLAAGAAFCSLLSWKDVAQRNLRPSERLLSFLHEQLTACIALEELLTSEISFIECNTPPSSKRTQQLLKLHQGRMVGRQQSETILLALSPIQWLPREILMEIFYYCLPDNYHFSRIFAPLLICRICRLWRTLALSSSGLWRKLSFWSPPSSKRDLLCYPTRLVNQWISHSGSLPLQLFFDHGMTRSHLKTYVELVLLEHYPRCQHLEFSLTPASAWGLLNFINLPFGSLTGLESVVLEDLDEADLVSSDNDSNEDNPFPITALQLSPRLRKLTTSYLEFTHHLSTYGTVFHSSVVPWSGLTHLKITRFVHVEIFAAALAECVDLQFLRVSLSLRGGEEEFVNADPEGTPTNVVLPHLTAMFISIDGGSSFPPELDAFSFPALVDLHIRRDQESDDAKEKDEFSWSQSDHFRRQLSHLRYCHLTGHVGSTAQVIVLLGGMPNLVRLSLDAFIDYSALLPALFPSGSTTSPIKHIRHLELHLQSGELDYPRGPPNTVIRDTSEGTFSHSRMRHITDRSQQPCLFRFRELIESTRHPGQLNALWVFVLQGATGDKILRELNRQFFTSNLQTHFTSKEKSLRGCSDEDLIEKHSISYTLQ